MIVLSVVGLIGGLVVAALASRRAVGAALDAVDALGVSAGLVGMSVMAIGTDLPEIATSVTGSLSGHGDLVVGDAIGSTLTQVTLILAILLIAARTLDFRGAASEERSVAIIVGMMTVGGLLLVAVLLADGRVSRWDGVLLAAVWVVCLWWLGRRERASVAAVAVPRDAVGAALKTIVWLTVVGGAATVTVRSFIELTEAIGVPEFVASSVVLSLGTSMPELVVDWVAIRRGAAALAIGDLFGSSLVDATLVVGIGPIFREVAVSSEAVTGALVIAVGVAATAVAIAWAQRREQVIAASLAAYVVSMGVLVVLTG